MPPGRFACPDVCAGNSQLSDSKSGTQGIHSAHYVQSFHTVSTALQLNCAQNTQGDAINLGLWSVIVITPARAVITVNIKFTIPPPQSLSLLPSAHTIHTPTGRSDDRSLRSPVAFILFP